jgi:hypothetical protein
MLKEKNTKFRKEAPYTSYKTKLLSFYTAHKNGLTYTDTHER